MKWIPNVLTIGRCVCAVLVLVGFWQAGVIDLTLSSEMPRESFEQQAILQQLWFQFAFFAFVTGALTDFLDGWLARKLNAHSRFGVWLDPIADKVLVAAALFGLALTLRSWLVYIPAAMIIARDVFMTWFRTTPRGASAVSPSGIAKWKTAIEMLAIIGLMLPYALWARSYAPVEAAGITWIWSYLLIAMLWVAGALSWWTAILYLKSAGPAD